MPKQPSKGRPSGGRAGNAMRRSSLIIDQMPQWLKMNVDRPTVPLDEEGINTIHDGAMRILEEIGIEFVNQGTLEILKQRGCTVQEQNVGMGREFVMEMIAKVSGEWTLTSRNLV